MDWKAMKITSLCPSGGGETRNTAKAMGEGHFLGSGSPPEATIGGFKLPTLLTQGSEPPEDSGDLPRPRHPSGPPAQKDSRLRGPGPLSGPSRARTALPGAPRPPPPPCRSRPRPASDNPSVDQEMLRKNILLKVTEVTIK
ncbi:protein enabled-like [Ailuropoda melanoleuca]|uniref:protein enabled-like n=1 Tax=Ailuropoda melanoleuca TaxID=9646 RepID=UPI00149495A6|nr:protein enabled-like [Ailuropoda melanoleuca]